MSSEMVGYFSLDGSQFAFQANIAQKNFVDVYPLDSSNNFNVNSSLVTRIDYESNDLIADEALFMGWCTSPATTASKLKRDTDGEGIPKADNQENYFVSVFPEGKIVVFAPNGKDIVNIIKNKHEITHTDISDEFIWIVDADNTVKKFQFSETKPAKTFHLTDGKNEEIVHFQILNSGSNPIVAVASEQTVYIIDASKRKPSTVAKLDVFGALTCQLLDSDDKIAIATVETLSVFDLSTGEIINTWKIQSEKIKKNGNLLFSVNVDGNLSILDMKNGKLVNTISVNKTEIIDFSIIGDSLMVAWLNVNEPNFKKLSIEDIKKEKSIELKSGAEESESVIDQKKTIDDIKVEETGKKIKKKVSKAEQDETSNELIILLDTDGKNDEILSNITSESWNRDRINKFIKIRLTADSQILKLFNLLSDIVENNIWNIDDRILTWLEWLLTLKSSYLNSSKSKQVAKKLKHFKVSLKTSAETLPILIGIQGKLEMLKRQALLRKELTQLKLENDKNEIVNIDEGETNVKDKDDSEDNITYVNGESDAFFDASEFKE
ncbi:hypothetical protein TPHA_0L00250 [Tetrapisispora phaffii CBS 4417]|uniref:Small-subunit processome Utp12 domain-containing protein n=1 Tax=Tetrapisispora phaffii (strain ATCC 24235 / CBS 4417 / NBRC 1672 / NRRL Y-8282 / UCD 70-5) TaxID=1071381 RepID=G8BZQ4_TETPH|nr:hypothetical protein TPHA_0L00250 [Tetrapisispora phaffii CBS 4417]CCE65382.1 hypothetical protein TPHA_0L00250 [Tetrapisispora phaffii CBS 4417]